MSPISERDQKIRAIGKPYFFMRISVGVDTPSEGSEGVTMALRSMYVSGGVRRIYVSNPGMEHV